MPKYIQGKCGRVVICYGSVANPLDHDGIYSPLYSIEFEITESTRQKSRDKVTADIHEDSLEAAD